MSHPRCPVRGVRTDPAINNRRVLTGILSNRCHPLVKSLNRKDLRLRQWALRRPGWQGFEVGIGAAEDQRKALVS